MSTDRIRKDALYEQVARIAKASASPKRLELLELLCQAPKAVEDLARESGTSVKLASAHLKALRGARLVEAQRQGKHIIYRIASDSVPRYWVVLRSLAQERLTELQQAVHALAQAPVGAARARAALAGAAQADAIPPSAVPEWRAEDRAALLRKARSGEVVVIDVRPDSEYAQAHLPFARSMPLAQLRSRLAELPPDRPVVAYCRGPYCFMSEDAVQWLQQQGYQAWVLREGVADWWDEKVGG
ncbi:MAG: ArsR/SmtB family transcription factor [Rhodoferax sp.]